MCVIHICTIYIHICEYALILLSFTLCRICRIVSCTACRLVVLDREVAGSFSGFEAYRATSLEQTTALCCEAAESPETETHSFPERAVEKKLASA